MEPDHLLAGTAPRTIENVMLIVRDGESGESGGAGDRGGGDGGGEGASAGGGGDPASPDVA